MTLLISRQKARQQDALFFFIKIRIN